MNTTIGKNLKRLRLQKDFTQEQAAEALGVNAQTISRWECGTTCPDIMLLPEIARLYCVTVDDLFEESSVAYENYAQRLASIYEVTRKPEDYCKADAEFNKLKALKKYSLEDCRIHGVIHASMMCLCKQAAIQNFNHIVNTFENANETAPENKVYWKTRHQILHYYIEVGQADAICKQQKERLAQSADQHMEWITLIYAYYYAGKYQEAYEYFTKAKDRFSDKWEIYEIGSYVCRALKRYEEAIQYCDISYNLNAEYLDAVYSKAFCYQEMGNYEEAYHTWLQIIACLKKEGYTAEAQREEVRAQACLEKINQKTEE